MLLSLTKVHPFHAMTCKLMSQFNVLAILPEKLKSLHCSKLIRSLYIFIFYNNAILEFVSKKKKGSQFFLLPYYFQILMPIP